ncbi:hypothetical protein LCGC14_2188790 [marine sediment metagenome]|uniref:Uncharacterized protein n=1 Tax=marine sediment metagenome TaxID=412755 RepID=A0A0F9E779_9ZZZZ
MNKSKLKYFIRELVTHMCFDMFGGGVYYYQGEYDKDIDKIMEAIEEEIPNAEETDS